MRSISILLTATIDPGHTTMVARNDPKTRLSDYQVALKSWISTAPPLRVVFCENSSHDLAALRALVGDQAGDRVEFISFNGNRGGQVKGKGFAELGTIGHAMAASRLIAESDLVVKCTGRIAVRNAPRVMRSIASSDCDVMCTLKRFLSFADSRIFCATPAFIRDRLLPIKDMVDDARGIYLEHALARAVADAVAHGENWRPFPVLPRIEGISGTFGTPMTDSAPMAAARSLYNGLRNVIYRR